MTIIFILAGLYLTCLGSLILFFPQILIELNDWLTEKILLHKAMGVIARIVIGGITLSIAGIFWWAIFSK